MGQPISVVEKRSSNPAIIRFETNRPLSGMSHERYTSPPEPLLDRPVDELARRMFAHGGVQAVHMNGSTVTVTLAAGSTGSGLADVISRLFLHYPPVDDPDVAVVGDDGTGEAEARLSAVEAAPEVAADTAEATDDSVEDAPAPTGDVAEGRRGESDEAGVIVDPATADGGAQPDGGTGSER